MAADREEQKEALEVLLKFNDRLVKNMKSIVKELTESRMEDTDKFLTDIVSALNWEIQVVNGTMDLLNEDRERIDKSAFNEKIQALSGALAAKDDAQIAEKISEVIPVFEAIGGAAKEVVS